MQAMQSGVFDLLKKTREVNHVRQLTERITLKSQQSSVSRKINTAVNFQHHIIKLTHFQIVSLAYQSKNIK